MNLLKLTTIFQNPQRTLNHLGIQVPFIKLVSSAKFALVYLYLDSVHLGNTLDSL